MKITEIKSAITGGNYDKAFASLYGADFDKTAVYERYKIWCVNHGHHAESMRNFKQSIMTFGNVVRKRPKAGGSETTILTGYKLVREFI